MKGEELDDVERLRLFGRAGLALRAWENMHYQYRTGVLTDEEWRGFKKNLEAVFEWPSVRTVWENEKPFYSPVFQAEIESILEGANEKPDWHSHSYVARKPV